MNDLKDCYLDSLRRLRPNVGSSDFETNLPPDRNVCEKGLCVDIWSSVKVVSDVFDRNIASEMENYISRFKTE